MGNNFIIDKSFQLIRTNPRLTTNMKINVDSDQKIYLESFDTNKQLSDDKYKHFSMTETSLLEDKVILFYDGLPTNLAYEVKNKLDKDIVYTNYSEQFDDIYWSGVKKIEQNKFYKEEFEYFAPLYFQYKELPSNFIIMRVDNPGVYEISQTDYNISTTTRHNFKEQIVDKWKNVSIYDLTIKSSLGTWLDKNFISNERFPISSFEFDSKTTNFSRWYGIDYKSGSYTEKSRFISDKIWYEQPHFRLEEYITDGFKDNNIIYPNIINMNYLFDDTPATPFKLNKYSLNRYFGFYVDLEKIETLTPYESKPILPGLKIVNNIFMLSDATSGSTSPFFQSDSEWNEKIDYYLYVKDDLFKVDRIKKDWGYSYTILSKYDVNINDITRDKELNIVFTEGTNFTYKNKLDMRNTALKLDRIVTDYGALYLYADLYLIEIDGKYHVLEYKNEGVVDEYLIRSDYGFKCDSKTLKYWIENETTKSNTVIVHDQVNKEKPIIFNIYRVKFRDIKDFDYNRIDTGYADFDFDKVDEYVETQEHKLYCVEHLDASEEVVFKDYSLAGTVNPGKRIIASSEYVADDELYELTKNGLTTIWDKNQSIPKWAYSGSISHADYPYKLNNSNKVGSIYNKITDIHNNRPDIQTKTNDFFYRIGTFISGSTDGTTFDYKYFKTQSLSIETDSYQRNDEPTQFDLDIYLRGDFDYFDYFLNNKRYINDDKEYIQTQQYSVFNNGTKYNRSSTLFKGIKYELTEVVDIIRDENGVIEKYLISDRDFNQYKFCILSDYTQSGTTLNTDETYENVVGKLREYPDSGIKYSGNLGQNNINIFYNEKYKNILVILRLECVVSGTTISINNVGSYDKEVIYNGSGKGLSADYINTSLSTANNFINMLNNNDMINYYYIDFEGNSGTTTNKNNDSAVNGNMSSIPSWLKTYSPIKISTLDIDALKIKKKSFNVSALKGPKTNIYDKYKNDFNEPVYENSFITEPLSRIIELNEKEIEPRAQFHGETIIYDKTIFRYNGPFEPIFKNISLFEPSDYYVVDGSEFKQNKCGGVFSDEGTVSNWLFGENSLSLCNNTYSLNVLEMPINISHIPSNNLKITNFGFDIPSDSVIKGITVKIKKYAETGPTSGLTTQTSYYSSVSDKVVCLLNNGVQYGDNYAITGIPFSFYNSSYENSGYWYNSSFITEYGSSDNLWSVLLTSDIINSDNFGVMIAVSGQSSSSYDAVNTAYIDCVCVDVSYTINGVEQGIIYTSSMERNVKFDIGLSDFGEIDNMIYSKVNEKENMLKLKSTKEDKSLYPMIDEFGYGVDKRFIFKSSWDSDYYIKTKNELR